MKKFTEEELETIESSTESLIKEPLEVISKVNVDTKFYAKHGKFIRYMFNIEIQAVSTSNGCEVYVDGNICFKIANNVVSKKAQPIDTEHAADLSFYLTLLIGMLTIFETA